MAFAAETTPVRPIDCAPRIVTSQEILSGQRLALRDPPPRPRIDDPTGIPTLPSTPPQLGPSLKVRYFSCNRQFLHQGNLNLIDSYHRQDGEKLRSVINDVPEAVSELNIYQRNRRRVMTAAYVSSIGLLVFLISQVIPADGDQGIKNIRRNMTYGGPAISLGSIIYSFTLIKRNETHLDNAVNNYNAARPEDPIKLQFSTGLLF